MRLLTENISPAQRDQLALLNYFEVIGGDTGTRYRIYFGDQMNVEVLDRNGNRAGMLCFMPAGHIPVADTMLAQKIALESFENETLRIARGHSAWVGAWDRPPYGLRY